MLLIDHELSLPFYSSLNKNEAIENNLHYDFLLAKPQNRDFFKEYDNAIKLHNNSDNENYP